MNQPTTPDQIVTEFMHAVEANDLDRACGMVTDDCEYDNVPIGKVHGPDGIRQILAGLLAQSGQVEWVVYRQVSSGDLHHGVVLNERLDRFQLGDRWMELPVAGVFVVDDGRISLWRDYFDQGTLMAQMTPTPTPTPTHNL